MCPHPQSKDSAVCPHPQSKDSAVCPHPQSKDSAVCGGGEWEGPAGPAGAETDDSDVEGVQPRRRRHVPAHLRVREFRLGPVAHDSGAMAAQ